MIGGKRVLAIIPARGGSKGVPRKNIRVVAGKSLIAWTVEAARGSRYIDRLIVSTDDPEIAQVAIECSCEVPFMRPPELALDDTPGVAPVHHALQTLPESYDIVVLLQPTSPLREAVDIDGCLELMMRENAKACVSVVMPDKSPYWMYGLGGGQRLEPLLENRFIRRQEIPPVYALNGAVYVADSRWMLTSDSFVCGDTVAYIMPKERSLDIDDEVDFSICSLFLQKRMAGT